MLLLSDISGQEAVATHTLISQRAAFGTVAGLSHCGSSRREEKGEDSHSGEWEGLLYSRQGLLLYPMLGFKIERPQ